MKIESDATVDARPAFPIALDSLWDQAAKKRDEVAMVIESEFKSQNVIAWIRKSQPGEYPLYVIAESWIPKGETNYSVSFDRNYLKVTVSVQPYRLNPFRYEAKLKHGGNRIFNGENWLLKNTEQKELLKKLVGYLIQGGKKPDLSHFKYSIFSKFRYAIAKSKVGSFFPSILIPSEYKFIPEARPSRWPVVWWWSGLLFTLIGLFLMGLTGEGPSLGPLLFLVGISSLIIFAIVKFFRRETLDVIPKQSVRTPRREFRVDSWHVSVPGAGEQFEQFRERIYNVVKTKDPSVEIIPNYIKG